jgi:hypothetical protein
MEPSFKLLDIFSSSPTFSSHGAYLFCWTFLLMGPSIKFLDIFSSSPGPFFSWRLPFLLDLSSHGTLLQTSRYLLLLYWPFLLMVLTCSAGPVFSWDRPSNFFGIYSWVTYCKTFTSSGSGYICMLQRTE